MEGLFERARELAELEAALTAAANGEGSLVLVEGPAGIGKSRLLAEFRRRARGRVTVLSARGSELEQDFAFGVVRQLLEAETVTPERRDQLLRGAAAAAVAVFGDPDDGDTGGDSFATLHGLYWLVLNLAEEGKGPIAPMRAFLDSATLRDTPPEVVIWEFPIRYLGQTQLWDPEPAKEAAE